MVSKQIREKYAPLVVLFSWRELLEALPYMNEYECKAALDEEVSKPKGDRRWDMIERLHRRYCRLRQEREIDEMREGK